MKIYKVTLLFVNLDNSLYTDTKATMFFEIQAGDDKHAHLLAKRLQKTFDADTYLME